MSEFAKLEANDCAFWAFLANLSFSVSAHLTTKGTVEPYLQQQINLHNQHIKIYC